MHISTRQTKIYEKIPSLPSKVILIPSLPFRFTRFLGCHWFIFFVPLSAIVVTFLLIHPIHRYCDRLTTSRLAPRARRMTACRLHLLPPSVRRPCVSSPLSHVHRPRTHAIAGCLASLVLVVSRMPRHRPCWWWRRRTHAIADCFASPALVLP